MKDKEYYSNAVRQGLTDYSEEEKYIDLQIERYERISTKIFTVGAQQITDMPRAPSPASDRMTDKVALLDTLDKNIREEVELHQVKRREIEAEVRKLKKAEEKTVILLKYIDGFGWKEVAESMYASCADLEERRETYERRMYLAHAKAIENIADNIMNGSGRPLQFLSDV